MATRRIRDPEAFGREAPDACQRLLGRDAVEVDWPASRSRRSVRVNFADGAVIATRRRRRERSELEAYVLKTLHDHGASVPAVLAYDGQWLLQKFIDGTRLPHLLVGDDRELSRTAEALSQIHQIGAESGLNLRVTAEGARVLCARGMEFAGGQASTAPLVQWFEDVGATLAAT